MTQGAAKNKNPARTVTPFTLPLLLVVLEPSCRPPKDSLPPSPRSPAGGQVTEPIPFDPNPPEPEPPDFDGISMRVCPRYGAPEVVATLDDPRLSELSGLVTASGAYFTHNDSGNPPELFALSPLGKIERTVRWSGPQKDWEDLAWEVDAKGQRFLYIGDIGDNRSSRRNGIEVLRLPQPDPKSTRPVVMQSFTLHYPDQPRDAEALMIDPLDRTLVIVSKPLGGWPEVWTVPLPLTNQDVLHRAAVLDPGLTIFPLQFVTSGDISHDGEWIVLRTYTGLYLFHRLPRMSVAEALSAQPCLLPTPDEPQGESVAFESKPSEESPPPVYTVSEGIPSRIFRLSSRP